MFRLRLLRDRREAGESQVAVDEPPKSPSNGPTEAAACIDRPARFM
jgi:hypothetical protein